MSASSAPPIEVFISYSHKDDGLREQLGTHLAILKREGVIDLWHDRRIGAARDWAGVIDAHLNSAAVVLLLVSADFLASDYCYDAEMTRALERHNAGDARVIPVILRPVDWQGAPFARLQALPSDGVPIATKRDVNSALAELISDIRRFIIEPSSQQRPDFSRIAASSGIEFDVFMSHSHTEADMVEHLAGTLEDRYGLRVWLDRWLLPPGKLWQQEISRALTQTNTCAVCIGSRTPSGWFKQEIQRALNIQAKKPEEFSVIPVLLPGASFDNVDDFLELRTWVDFSPDIENHDSIHRLVCGIRRIPPGRIKVAYHTPDDSAIFKLRKLARIGPLIDEDIRKRHQDKIVEEYLRAEGAEHA